VSGRRSAFSGARALAIRGALAVAAGFGSATGGALTVAVGVVSATGGVLTVAVCVASATTGVVAVAVGVASATTGVLAVAAGVASGTGVVVAAAVAQCSEIMLTPVTATLLSGDPVVGAFAFCPVSSTLWPTCAFKSTVLVVILKD